MVTTKCLHPRDIFVQSVHNKIVQKTHDMHSHWEQVKLGLHETGNEDLMHFT